MIAEFLKRLKQQILDQPFTKDRSQIVDTIDQWEGNYEGNEEGERQVDKGNTGEPVGVDVEE